MYFQKLINGQRTPYRTLILYILTVQLHCTEGSSILYILTVQCTMGSSILYILTVYCTGHRDSLYLTVQTIVYRAGILFML